jgi:hypothetical protein
MGPTISPAIPRRAALGHRDVRRVVPATTFEAMNSAAPQISWPVCALEGL